MSNDLVKPAEKPAAMPAVAFGAGLGLAPTDLNGAWRCAQLVASSGLAPKQFNGNPSAVMVAAAMGAEIGLSFMQSIQSIAVINGRPSLWGDALLALCENTGQLVEFSETTIGEGDKLTAVCRATRVRANGVKRQVEEQFSVADAKLANLWSKDGPWKQYPRRMLKMRARSFALRDLFADVLRGVRTTEEAIDVPAEYSIETLTVDEARKPPQPLPEIQTSEPEPPSLPLRKTQPEPEMTAAEVVDGETGEVITQPPEDERPPVEAYEEAKPAPEAPKAEEKKPTHVTCPGPRKPGLKINVSACREVCEHFLGCAAVKGL